MSKLVSENINDYLPAPSEEEIEKRLETKVENSSLDDLIEIYKKIHNREYKYTYPKASLRIEKDLKTKLEEYAKENPLDAAFKIQKISFFESTKIHNLYSIILPYLESYFYNLASSQPKRTFKFIITRFIDKELLKKLKNVFDKLIKNIDSVIVSLNHFNVRVEYDFKNHYLILYLRDLFKDDKQYEETIQKLRKLVTGKNQYSSKHFELLKPFEVNFLKIIGYMIDRSRKMYFDNPNSKFPEKLYIPIKKAS